MNKELMKGGNPATLEPTQMTRSQRVEVLGIPFKGNTDSAFESYALCYGGITSCLP